MSGVEILAAEQVATAFGFGWTAFWAGGLLVGVILALAFWGLAESNYLGTGGTIVVVVIGFLIGMGVFGTLIGATSDGVPTAYETHYKVTVSDEVPMTEFLEHYEIIDQEGKIFIVREVE